MNARAAARRVRSGRRGVVSLVVATCLGIALSIGPGGEPVSAHPGGTDSSGCHVCRTNCPSWGLQTGQYHCHDGSGGGGGSPAPPPADTAPPPPPPPTAPPTTTPPPQPTTTTTTEPEVPPEPPVVEVEPLISGARLHITGAPGTTWSALFTSDGDEHVEEGELPVGRTTVRVDLTPGRWEVAITLTDPSGLESDQAVQAFEVQPATTTTPPTTETPTTETPTTDAPADEERRTATESDEGSASGIGAVAALAILGGLGYGGWRLRTRSR